jgi:hypothetical protein
MRQIGYSQDDALNSSARAFSRPAKPPALRFVRRTINRLVGKGRDDSKASCSRNGSRRARCATLGTFRLARKAFPRALHSFRDPRAWPVRKPRREATSRSAAGPVCSRRCRWLAGSHLAGCAGVDFLFAKPAGHLEASGPRVREPRPSPPSPISPRLESLNQWPTFHGLVAASRMLPSACHKRLNYPGMV